MDLTREVARAKARLHRSIAQRARWARADFLCEIKRLWEQAELLYPEQRTVSMPVSRAKVEAAMADWNGEQHG